MGNGEPSPLSCDSCVAKQIPTATASAIYFGCAVFDLPSRAFTSWHSTPSFALFSKACATSRHLFQIWARCLGDRTSLCFSDWPHVEEALREAGLQMWAQQGDPLGKSATQQTRAQSGSLAADFERTAMASNDPLLSFLSARRTGFRRIAARTCGEHTVEDVSAEPWLIAEEISRKRGLAIDFLNADDQELVLSWLHLVEHLSQLQCGAKWLPVACT